MDDERETVELLTRAVVEDVAPEETPFFQYLSEMYFDQQHGKGTFVLKRGEEDAGFGIPGTDVILTNLLFAVLAQIVRAMGQGALESIKDIAKENMKRVLQPYVGKILKEVQHLAREKDVQESAKITNLVEYLEGIESADSGGA